MTDLLTRIENNQPIEAQELYDFVVAAIVKQGRPSVGSNDRCLYRGPDGLKCAYGHVHPDSMYSEKMESRNVERLSELNLIPKSLFPHKKLLKNLQADHDAATPYECFMGKFLSFSMQTALSFGLKPHGENP
jgi:hypothetical protein